MKPDFGNIPLFDRFPSKEALDEYVKEFDHQDPPYGNCCGVTLAYYSSTSGQFDQKEDVYMLLFGNGGIMYVHVPQSPRRLGDVK